MKAQKYSYYLLVLPIAIATLFAGSLVAGAQTFPASVATTILDSNLNATTSAMVGATVSDTVTVTSASSTSTTTPTGNVDFMMFPNTSCSATSTTQSGVALVNGSATSSTATVPSTGLSFMAQYNGDTLYASSSSPCEPLTAIAAPTSTVPSSIATTILDSNLNATTSVAAGSDVWDQATVTSGSSTSTTTPTGNVDFTMFPNTTCLAPSSATDFGVPLVNGTVTTATTTVPSSGLSFLAHYNGDSVYASSSSTCESLAITGTSTGTTTSGVGAISGTVYNDQNKNGTLDSGEPGLAGWTINLYTGANFPGRSNGDGPLATMVSDSNGNYSFNSLADGTYSVEELKNPSSGFQQFTSDYSSVVISGGITASSTNFGDIAKSTGNGNGNKDKDKDNNDHNNGHNNNGHDNGKGNDGKNNGGGNSSSTAWGVAFNDRGGGNSQGKHH